MRLNSRRETARGKVAGSGYDLPAEFVLLGGRGFVPVTALGGMLPRVLSQAVQLQPGERLLIGPIGFSFSQQVRADAHALVLNFPSPVNPMIATEPGRIRLTFTREPVIRPADGGAQKFSDPVIQSTSVVASNGALQLTVNVASPVIANFSDGNKTITLVTGCGGGECASEACRAELRPRQLTRQRRRRQRRHAPARPAVVIDAAHGGSDHGAILAGNIPEKDLTLSLARLIQHDLEAQGVATRMLRTGDTDLDFDQRAAAANSPISSPTLRFMRPAKGAGFVCIRRFCRLRRSRPRTNSFCHGQSSIKLDRFEREPRRVGCGRIQSAQDRGARHGLSAAAAQ